MTRRHHNEKGRHQDGAVSNNVESKQVVSTRHRAKTALCQDDAVPIICRLKTMSWQHGVVSRRHHVRRHRVNNSVVPTRHCAKKRGGAKSMSCQTWRRADMRPCQHDASSTQRRVKMKSCQCDAVSRRRRANTTSCQCDVVSKTTSYQYGAVPR